MQRSEDEKSQRGKVEHTRAGEVSKNLMGMEQISSFRLDHNRIAQCDCSLKS